MSKEDCRNDMGRETVDAENNQGTAKNIKCKSLTFDKRDLKD
jgi:hypothetical protein